MGVLKILLTVAVIYAVWFFFKYRSRITVANKGAKDETMRDTTAKGKRTPGVPVAQDLVPCPKCGSYIPAGTACSCEKV
jgi:hypothetical protein